MAQLNDTLINGQLKVTDTVYGSLNGNATTATKPYATLLTSSDDLNNVKPAYSEICEYYWTSSSQPSHTPFSDATDAILLVYGTSTSPSTYCLQVVFRASKGIYQRKLINNQWSDWEKVLVSSDNAASATKATNDGNGNQISTTYLKRSGDSMTGALCINPDSTHNSYNEGIRLNQASNGYVSLTLGGAANSTEGTRDNEFWIGCHPGNSNANIRRRLYIAHNASSESNTYFGATSSSDKSPYLNLGQSGTVASGDTKAVTGGAVYDAIKFRGATFVSGNENYNYNGTYSSATSFGKSNPNSITNNGVYYCGSSSYMPSASLGWHTSNADRDGAVYAQAYSESWIGEIAQDYRTGILCVRGKNNGSWQSWQRVVSSANFLQTYNSSTQSIDFTFV